jgi:transcriptional antiterminator NusG
MSNWYIFHVKTGSEQTACNFLNKLFDKEESVAFIPQVEMILKNSKVTSKYLKPMFPGYVFTDSILKERSFVNLTYKYVRFSKCIFKILGSENINFMKLRDDEKNFLLGFLNNEYVTEESKGLIIGDKVYVTSGPLQGRESIIKKIDRHKRRAEIELMCFSDIRRVSVALEIVEKV